MSFLSTSEQLAAALADESDASRVGRQHFLKTYELPRSTPEEIQAGVEKAIADAGLEGTLTLEAVLREIGLIRSHARDLGLQATVDSIKEGPLWSKHW